MSLVGPRPDLTKYLAQIGSDLRIVFALAPGITGPATLRFRNEEEILGTIPLESVESFYVNTLLPQKVAIELEYARTAGMISDAVMLFRTVIAIFN